MLKIAVVALMAACGLSACTSDPSATRVADDLINTCMQDSNPCDLSPAALASDTDAARECMLGKIDDVGSKELEKLGDEALNGDKAKKKEAQAKLDALQVGLESCLK
jgi:hypothetical protein